jgi:hypothetical protein
MVQRTKTTSKETPMGKKTANHFYSPLRSSQSVFVLLVGSSAGSCGAAQPAVAPLTLLLFCGDRQRDFALDTLPDIVRHVEPAFRKREWRNRWPRFVFDGIMAAMIE